MLDRNTIQMRQAYLPNFIGSELGVAMCFAWPAASRGVRKRNYFAIGYSMSPIVASNDPADCTSGYSELPAELFLGAVACGIDGTDLLDIFSCQLSAGNALTFGSSLRVSPGPVVFTAGCDVPALLYAISAVFLLGSEEEMGGIAAGWVVALMTNKLIRRINPIVDVVSNTMGFEVLSSELDLTVATGELGILPWPTLTQDTNGDVSPETVDVGLGKLGHRVVVHSVVLLVIAVIIARGNSISERMFVGVGE